MKPRDCPLCRTRVFESTDGTCPACRGSIRDLAPVGVVNAALGPTDPLPERCCSCGAPTQNVVTHTVHRIPPVILGVRTWLWPFLLMTAPIVLALLPLVLLGAAANPLQWFRFGWALDRAATAPTPKTSAWRVSVPARRCVSCAKSPLVPIQVSWDTAEVIVSMDTRYRDERAALRLKTANTPGARG